MDTTEIEFLAEKEIVTVVSNFSMDKIYLIGGDIGPFNSGLTVEVPLWVAIMLKQRQKCRIIPPKWMDIGNLKQKKQEETDSKFFTMMPSKHYMELSQLLLKYAPESIPHADEIRTLLKDIWDLRIAKLRSSIDLFIRSEATQAKLNYLTLLELNTVRPILPKSLEYLLQLRSNAYGQAPSYSQN